MQFIDLQAQYQHLKTKIDKRIADVLNHGKYIMGPEVQELEQALAKYVGVKHVVTCANGTDALSLALMVFDIKKGDAVFCPTFTFFATAEVISFANATPVFVDSNEQTFNICPVDLEKQIQKVISDGKLKPKAIIAVDLFGLPANYAEIEALAKKYDLKLIEDAAQGVMSSYKGQSLGSIGHMGTYSFHETKNVISGEGGALLVNDSNYAERAEIIREKGTDRSNFFRGHVDKYTWQDFGSSFLPGEIIAAFLWAQLERANDITNSRLDIWNYYNELLEPFERAELLKRPTIPIECQHNAHMYYLILPNRISREMLIQDMLTDGINAVFHYVPLHSSPAGKRFGEVSGSMHVTNNLSSRLLRLPLWVGLSRSQQEVVCESLISAISKQL